MKRKEEVSKNAKIVWATLSYRNFRTRKLISRWTGISTRILSDLVLELQENGYPVISSKTKPYGYKIATNFEEMDIAKNAIKSHAEAEFHRFYVLSLISQRMAKDKNYRGKKEFKPVHTRDGRMKS